MSISPSDPTYRGIHRVLLAGKNMQALARLFFDLLPLLERDPRLHVAFAVIPGSHFEWAAHRFLRERERLGAAVVLDWSMVERYGPELIVSCSPSDELFSFGVPFMVLTHGAGNNRVRDDLSGVYGLAPEQLLGPGEPGRRRVVDWLPLAGRAAMEQLARDCPEALGAAEIVGDLCLERMLGSLVKRREYRKALGIGRDQKFIVMASTWGALSLIGESRSTLLERMFRELPMERFALGAVPHPNIEHGDGPSMSGLLAPRLENGLLMPQVHEGWRAMLIAADLVVGDSGSVTQYAGAIRRPILLSAFGYDQMPPDGALAGIGKAAPWLDQVKPLIPQLLEAIERGPVLDYGGILAADRSPSALITAKIHAMLGIPAYPLPEPKILPVTALNDRCAPAVCWRFVPGRGGGSTFPVSVPEEAHGLVVVRFEPCDDKRLLARADVVLHHDSHTGPDEARLVLVELMEDWAHCRIASVLIGHGLMLLKVRGGPRFEVRCDPRLVDVVPAALQHWLSQRAPDPAGLDAPDALVDFEGGFESPPTFRPFGDLA